MVVCHVVDLLVPLPTWVWTGLHDITFALPNLWALLRGRPVEVHREVVVLSYVVPGALLMLLAWPFVQLHSRVARAGTMLLRLSARELSSGDGGAAVRQCGP